MATDAYIEVPQYAHAGYEKHRMLYGDLKGTVYLWITSDGDTLLPLVCKVLRGESEPEFFAGRMVQAMYADGWNTVLVQAYKPEEEGIEHIIKVDFKTRSVTYNGAVYQYD